MADLKVELEVPSEAVVGEPVFATVRVRNVGSEPRKVSARLNLSESDLRILVTDPGGRQKPVQGIAMMDSLPRPIKLQPGEHVEGSVGLHYTNVGFTFDREGPYKLRAEYDPGGAGELILSDEVRITVRPAISEEERELASLTMSDDVARSIALGDAGSDTATIEKLERLAERHADHIAGSVARIVLGNTFSRETRDVMRGTVARGEDRPRAEKIIERAFAAHDPELVVRVACGLLPPSDLAAGATRDTLEKHLDRLRKDTAADSDSVDRAAKLLSDASHAGDFS